MNSADLPGAGGEGGGGASSADLPADKEKQKGQTIPVKEGPRGQLCIECHIFNYSNAKFKETSIFFKIKVISHSIASATWKARGVMSERKTWNIWCD